MTKAKQNVFITFPFYIAYKVCKWLLLHCCFYIPLLNGIKDISTGDSKSLSFSALLQFGPGFPTLSQISYSMTFFTDYKTACPLCIINVKTGFLNIFRLNIILQELISHYENEDWKCLHCCECFLYQLDISFRN